MTLMMCPECNEKVSDQAIHCPKCAYPISHTIRPQISPEYLAGFKDCPSCKSSHTQEIKILWNQQTSSNSQIGIGISSRGTVGGMVGGGVSQTHFARSLHPGLKPDSTSAAGGCFMGCGGIVAIGCIAGLIDSFKNPAGMVGVICGGVVGGGIWLIGNEMRKQREMEVREKELPAWEKKMEIFEKGWVCLRCGESWIPDN